MADPLVEFGAVVTCPHQGVASIISNNHRVTTGKKALSIQDDKFQIVGCPFMVGDQKHPCMEVKTLRVAARVKIEGKRAILKSQGRCDASDGMVQGVADMKVTQERVKGT